MRITYLDHSGFAAEAGDTALIFDYYRGTLPDLPGETKVYVFASHIHPDHFKKKIFEWKRRFPSIHYILSDDIPVGGPEGACTYIGPCREARLDGLRIRTLRSTDEGVAFLVSVGERTFYHAGDLNWWHWEEEGEAYNERMRRNYQHEVKKLEGEKIDIAFLPLDPRLEGQYAWGFDYFMQHTKTGRAFPMHMWGQYGTCDRLIADPVSEPYRDRVVRIEGRQQIFEIGV